MTKRQTIDNIIARLNQAVYDICSDEMSKLEYAGTWVGNSHHAAQKMHALITKEIEPILTTAVSTMMLREENPEAYNKTYGGLDNFTNMD